MSRHHGRRRPAIRWTIGDVSPRGFEALRLSAWGAWRLFGPEADYVVCVNTVSPDEARARTGPLPDGVRWLAASADRIPDFLRARLETEMAEGVAWKFAPLRLFPDRHELSLDNDCILWDRPAGLRAWLDADDACLLAEDVRPCFGRFADLCDPAPRNSGIRGLPPGFDLEAALRAVLEARPGLLTSELDEQGLQVAALSRARPPHVVTVDEVSICSPFPPPPAPPGPLRRPLRRPQRPSLPLVAPRPPRRGAHPRPLGAPPPRPLRPRRPVDGPRRAAGAAGGHTPELPRVSWPAARSSTLAARPADGRPR